MRVTGTPLSIAAPLSVRRSAMLVALLAAATQAIPLPAQTDALTLEEVLDLKRRGVSGRQVLRNAQQYCISFTLTDSIEADLAAAGADSQLVHGLRETCVIHPTKQLPPGILLELDFAAPSAARYLTVSDRFCASGPDRSGLRLHNERRATGCAIPYALSVPERDVRLELTVAALTGDGTPTVVLGFAKDVESWDQYTFAVTSAGGYEAFRTIGPRREVLVRDRRRPAFTLPTADLRLAVEMRGRTVSLFINDERVGTFVVTEDLSGDVSLGVGPRSTAVFRQLRVSKVSTVARSD